MTDVVVLIDREQGGAARMASNGLRLHSAFTLSFILGVLQRHDLVSEQVAADVKAFITGNQTFDASAPKPAAAPTRLKRYGLLLAVAFTRHRDSISISFQENLGNTASLGPTEPSMTGMEAAECGPVDGSTVPLRIVRAGHGSKSSASVICRLPFEERAKLAQNACGKRLFELMARKRSNLAVAADVGTVQEMLRIAEAAGPHIAVLKTHVDIFDEWNSSIAAQLRKLAEEHGGLHPVASSHHRMSADARHGG